MFFCFAFGLFVFFDDSLTIIGYSLKILWDYLVIIWHYFIDSLAILWDYLVGSSGSFGDNRWDLRNFWGFYSYLACNYLRLFGRLFEATWQLNYVVVIWDYLVDTLEDLGIFGIIPRSFW